MLIANIDMFELHAYLYYVDKYIILSIPIVTKF